MIKAAPTQRKRPLLILSSLAVVSFDYRAIATEPRPKGAVSSIRCDRAATKGSGFFDPL
jgi:hypothetical protein